MIDNNNLKSIIPIVKRFIDRCFPYNSGIMITGSVLTEYFNEESDVDTVILSNIYRNIFIESYSFEQLKIQVIVLPLYDLDNVIDRDIYIGGGVYVHQLYNGKILYDPLGAFKYLKSKAVKLYKAGPKTISRFQFNQLRSRITSRLEDLRGGNDNDENIFTLLDLYPRIIDLFFQEHNSWIFHGKSASREMKSIDDDFRRQLVESIKLLALDGDKNAAVKFVSSFLENLGGEVHFSSTREYSEVVDTDILVIFVGDNGNYFLKKQCLAIEKRFLEFMHSHCSDLEIVGYYNPDGRVYRAGLYLICSSSAQRINEEILPLVEMFHIGLYRSNLSDIAKNFYYPYLLSPLGTFGDVSVQKKVIHILYLLNKECPKKESADYCFQLLLQFRNLKIFDTVNWKSFWKQMYEIFDKSQNRIYLPNNIFQLYSEQAESECIEQAKDWKLNNSVVCRDFTKEILTLESIANNATCYVPSPELSDSDAPVLNEVSFFKHFVEFLLNVLNVENKLFMAYLMKEID